MRQFVSAMFRVFLLGICLCSLARCVDAKKIIILPTPLDSSHTFTMRKIYDELMGRGHDVKVNVRIPATCHQIICVVASYVVEASTPRRGAEACQWQVERVECRQWLRQLVRVWCMQMMVVKDDIPKLTAVTRTGSVSIMTHQSPPLDLAGLIRHDHGKVPSFRDLTGQVQRLWGTACDALLSDAAAMAEVQV